MERPRFSPESAIPLGLLVAQLGMGELLQAQETGSSVQDKVSLHETIKTEAADYDKLLAQGLLTKGTELPKRTSDSSEVPIRTGGHPDGDEYYVGYEGDKGRFVFYNQSDGDMGFVDENCDGFPDFAISNHSDSSSTRKKQFNVEFIRQYLESLAKQIPHLPKGITAIDILL